LDEKNVFEKRNAKIETQRHAVNVPLLLKIIIITIMKI